MLAVVLNEARLLACSAMAELSALSWFGLSEPCSRPSERSARCSDASSCIRDTRPSTRMDWASVASLAPWPVRSISAVRSSMMAAYFVTTTCAGSWLPVAASRNSFRSASALRAVDASSRVCAEKELVDLVQLALHRGRGLVGQGVRLVHHAQLGSPGAHGGPPPGTLEREPDVTDGRIPFVLQTLGEDGDVGAERGELLNPPVGGGAARVREDSRCRPAPQRSAWGWRSAGPGGNAPASSSGRGVSLGQPAWPGPVRQARPCLPGPRGPRGRGTPGRLR